MTEREHIEQMLPPHTLVGIKNYIDHHMPTGGFLRSVFSNKLVQAFNQADSANTRALREIAIYLYNYAPQDCWGSEEKYNDWIKDCTG